MHVLLVRNHKSGSADQVDPAALLVRHGCVVTDAEIAQAARWSDSPPGSLHDVDRVIVAGGDGSLGPCAALAARLEVPIGVVPAGTANDFVRATGLPDDADRACLLAATGDRTRPIDLGRVDEVPFVNVASIGLAPKAAAAAEPLKRSLGAIAYPIGAAIAAIRSRPVDVSARIDGNLVWSGPAWQVMVASTGAFGGWAEIGSTRPGDGALDLVVVPAGRGTRALAFDAKSLFDGELARRDGVHHDRGRQVELALHRAPSMVVDGEIVQLDDRRVVARVEPDPVQLVVG